MCVCICCVPSAERAKNYKSIFCLIFFEGRGLKKKEVGAPISGSGGVKDEKETHFYSQRKNKQIKCRSEDLGGAKTSSQGVSAVGQGDVGASTNQMSASPGVNVGQSATTEQVRVYIGPGTDLAASL